MSLATHVFTYILGGLTFLPLCLVLLWYLGPEQRDTEAENEERKKFRAGEYEEADDSGVQALKLGWVTVTHEYWQSTEDISLSTQTVADSTDNKSAYLSLYKIANRVEEAETGGNAANGTGSASSLLLGASPGPSLDEKNVKGAIKRHRFYAVLKHGNLFLYKDASLKDVKHVIVLSGQMVTMWPRGLTDGQLFTKHSAICLMKKDWSRRRKLLDSFEYDTVSTQDIFVDENKHNISAPKGSVFLYCDYNIDKEDWYFALIRALKTDTRPGPLNPNIFAKPLHFATADMVDMIQTLYATEGQLHSKWFNALTGRLFLALQRTPAMSAFLENRIAKKLNKIKTPGFLEKFQIRKIDPGTSVPFFTHPCLKEVSPDGTLVVAVSVHYHGSMAIQIATKANIKLGSTFKPREVDLLLSVTLEKLEGQMLFKFKPPPSDRMWYTFETEPAMDLKIEPIISSRQFNYNIITSTIGKKFKEAIRDSLVLPHYDDLVFHNTLGEVYRGGIWDLEARGTDFDTEEVSPPESDAASVSTDVESEKAVPSAAKIRLASTLNDFSKKLKKSKSAQTAATDEQLSDVTNLDSSRNLAPITSTDTLGKKSMNTLKKIGNWYFKDDKKPESPAQSPDIFQRRRAPRKSNADQTVSAASVTNSHAAPAKSSIPSSSFIREGEAVEFPMSADPAAVHSEKEPSLEPHDDKKHPDHAVIRKPSSSFSDTSLLGLYLTQVTPANALAEDAPTPHKPRRKPPPEAMDLEDAGENEKREIESIADESVDDKSLIDESMDTESVEDEQSAGGVWE